MLSCLSALHKTYNFSSCWVPVCGLTSFIKAAWRDWALCECFQSANRWNPVMSCNQGDRLTSRLTVCLRPAVPLLPANPQLWLALTDDISAGRLGSGRGMSLACWPGVIPFPRKRSQGSGEALRLVGRVAVGCAPVLLLSWQRGRGPFCELEPLLKRRELDERKSQCEPEEDVKLKVK